MNPAQQLPFCLNFHNQGVSAGHANCIRVLPLNRCATVQYILLVFLQVGSTADRQYDPVRLYEANRLCEGNPQNG